MKTKKILLAAAVALLAASCNKTETETKSLEVSPTSLEFEAAGGTVQNVTVQAQNVTWEYSVSAAAQAWMTVSQEGNVLTVSVADNNKGEQRTGQIQDTGNGRQQTARTRRNRHTAGQCQPAGDVHLGESVFADLRGRRCCPAGGDRNLLFRNTDMDGGARRNIR